MVQTRLLISRTRFFKSRIVFSVVIFLALWSTIDCRRGSGFGADCFHPLSKDSAIPIFGACRQSQQLQGRTGLDSAVQTAASISAKERWILLWKEGSNFDQLSQQACLEAGDPESQFQGECTSTFHAVLHGISIKMAGDSLLKLLEHYGPFVASVHQDTGVVAHDVEANPPWGLDRLDQAFLPLDDQFNFYNLGTGVNVYIIDTGIMVTHVEFRYPTGQPGSRASEAYTSLTSGAVGQDCNGHGTHVAGTVGGLTYGPAKNSSLLAIRSLECLGNGTVTQVIDGLDWLITNHKSPAIAVLALGGDAQYALDQAAHNLVLAGVPVIVAAGNDGTDACTVSPARDPLVIAVAASDIEDQRLWLSSDVASNVGPCVSIWAPGTNILSASTRSNIASDYRSGTSQAAPFVAGCLALYLENNTASQPSSSRTVLNSWTVPNIITEPTASSPYGARYLNNTVNALLNIPKTSPLALSPSNCTILAGFSANCSVRVSLSTAPRASLDVNIQPSDLGRGRVVPAVLHFSPQNASQAQVVTFDYAEAALNTTRSQSFSLDFVISSSEWAFNGYKSKTWVFDTKGDTFAYPKVISQLPFQETVNTYFYEAAYNLLCGNDGAVGYGRDVVYYFQPVQDTNATISLCGNSSEPFNTQLFLLANLNSTNISAVACNDDHCGYQSLLQVPLKANVAYGIVVDSADGRYGTYSIQVTDAQQKQIGGMIPSVASLAGVSNNLPQGMLTGQGSGFLVTTVENPPGQTGPSPNPAPPPYTVVGTIPGPDVSTALPLLVNLSDYSGGTAPVTAPATAPGGAPPGSFQLANVYSPVGTPLPANSTLPPSESISAATG